MKVKDMPELLTIDHKHNDGAYYRRKVGAANIYRWLIDNDFPKRCNFGRSLPKNKGICPNILRGSENGD